MITLEYLKKEIPHTKIPLNEKEIEGIYENIRQNEYKTFDELKQSILMSPNRNYYVVEKYLSVALEHFANIPSDMFIKMLKNKSNNDERSLSIYFLTVDKKYCIVVDS